jgi:hypothetical protein
LILYVPYIHALGVLRYKGQAAGQMFRVVVSTMMTNKKKRRRVVSI